MKQKRKKLTVISAWSLINHLIFLILFSLSHMVYRGSLQGAAEYGGSFRSNPKSISLSFLIFVSKCIHQFELCYLILYILCVHCSNMFYIIYKHFFDHSQVHFSQIVPQKHKLHNNLQQFIFSGSVLSSDIHLKKVIDVYPVSKSP